MCEAYINKPQGFKACGIYAGLKTDPGNSGNTDLYDVALIYSETPAKVAGVYTSNLVKGHSLVRSIDLINSKESFRAFVINSKVANACVGQAGYEDAADIAACAAGELGITADEVLTASTGTIGVRLPVDKINAAIPKLASALSREAEDGHKAERAIMTTDTVPKEVSAEITLSSGKTVVISGMAKGSGMISPNLATMIGVFTTDADMDKALLNKVLKSAVSHSFNRVCVDGDTSVCDMVTLWANGASGAVIEEGSSDYDLFCEALTDLATDLSRLIAKDGEGATKLLEITVDGAASEKDALLIVSAVAKSPLVKTGFFGEDANFGRIITAAGYSGAMFDPDKIDIDVSGLPVCRDGIMLVFDEDEAAKLLHEEEIKIEIVLHEGDAFDRMFTCDFSYKYVEINGSYRT
ncbi:MAG: bifunctional glutamate N-acetyltransferase/amino-acid acetyltransferase ArgJ [Clostridiales bacterium]|nr:bifunctional glutamate N-acetyltransferase/amino-acid acetyltransferase ArgJ [Clostridiales bacterium]